MTSMKGLALLTVLITSSLVLTGCASLAGTAGRPAAAESPSDAAVPASVKPAAAVQAELPVANKSCPVPTGWVAYQVQTNETVFSIARRAGITAQNVLDANCLVSAADAAVGTWIAVPPDALVSQPQTILPLGISAFVANPVQVSAGTPITLVWQAQGPVVSVRVGWLYRGQFIEEAANLPAFGTWILAAPDDGRRSVMYVVRASDGLSEVAAQTTVHIACPEGWFFAPAPLDCPSPALITTFYEQSFERGSIVYIPSLRVHYVLIQGHTGREVADHFVPGMPLRDPALDDAIPAGLDQPGGAIHYAWRSDETIMSGLGYATGPAVTYTGLLQRLVDANGGETVYFSSSGGMVYRYTAGQMWRALIPQ